MVCQTVRLAGLALGFFPGWRPTSTGYIDNADAAYPVRCHWEREADAARCEDVVVFMEDAWRAQVDVAGFHTPFPDEDGRVDLYLTNDYTAGGAYTYNNEGDAVPKDGVLGGPAFIAIDWGVPDGELASYVAHEFNHVLQYATDMLEPTYTIWEGTATAAQQWTLGVPESSDTFYMRDFQEIPWMGLLGDGYLAWHGYDVYSYYEYGSVAWIRHLEYHWGDGTGAAGAALWWAAAQDRPPNEPDVIDAYDAVTGDWRDAWLMFHVERARMGTADPPAWQGLNDEMLQIAVEAELDYAELPAVVVPAVPLLPTGALYVAVTGMPAGSAVRVTAVGDGIDAWGTVAVEGPADARADADALSWVGGGETVLLGVVNLGYPEFDGDDPLSPRPLEVAVEPEQVQGPDTGDTGGDTGVIDSDTAVPPAVQGAPSGGGCGCGPGSDGVGSWGLLALPWIVRRRFTRYTGPRPVLGEEGGGRCRTPWC